MAFTPIDQTTPLYPDFPEGVQASDIKSLSLDALMLVLNDLRATGAELDTGTDDIKYTTAKALKDSHNIPDVAPGANGNILQSDGTDWVSSSVSPFGVSAVTAASPIVSSEGATPEISMPAATTAVDGYAKKELVQAVAANTAKVTNQTHTGDVTGSTALTIAENSVTLAKMADMATASLIYRKTAGSGPPEVNSLSTLKTDLAVPVKAVGSDLDAGTDDAKFATAKAIKEAHNVPSVAPGAAGHVLTSDGTDWKSEVGQDGLEIRPTSQGRHLGCLRHGDL